MKLTVKYLLSFFICISSIFIYADNGDVLNRKVQLPKSNETVYQLLKKVSEKTGYLFIYDSKIINNNKKVKIPKGEYTVQNAVHTITGNNNLKLRIVGNHILIYSETSAYKPKVQNLETDKRNTHFILNGTLVDRVTGDPILYGSVSVNNSSIGIITNLDGEFMLTLPDSLSNSQIRFSHLGYETREVNVSLLSENNITIALEPKIIPLQEVIVRLINPIQVIQDMLDKREANYPKEATYLTAFYREGVEHKKNNLNLTEAVMKLYKTGYKTSVNADQIKLLKMRRIINTQETDTLMTKMKSGPSAVLGLDIMKSLPDFLTIRKDSPYIYTHTDITVVDDRQVNVISFEQNQYSFDPLFRGELYIDIENSALLQARFEINPKYIKKATDSYVETKKKHLDITPSQITYLVSYKPIDGVYYINHVRGDLYFKIKKKKSLFSSTVHTWFEMVNCEVETTNVNRFPRSERLPVQNIFSETRYEYDQSFWGNFNVIIPEDKLREFISTYFSKEGEEINPN